MGAWNGWYHVDGHTYGRWLPGDPRGWREKRHARHVEGDYKNPPAPSAAATDLHRRSRARLKHDPVRLTLLQRQIAGKALVEMLALQEIEVLAVSMDAIHFHLLARFRDGNVRPCVGRAKKHAYFRLRERRPVRKIWERLSHVTPVADREHQMTVFRYILNHRDKGAWTWTYREGLYWQTDPDQPDPR